jgi:SAM-dependent methyltransferase
MLDSSSNHIETPTPARSECVFYHAMDFPDGESVAGVWDIRGQFDQYIGHYPISGKTVLDVGTASGFLAFEAEKRGARVTAIDALHATEFERIPFAGSLHQTDRRAWAAGMAKWHQGIKNGFWFARRKYASNVEMVYLPLAELPFWGRRFDVVIAGAIIEHLANPVPVLADLAAIANEAVIIAFTPVDDTDDQIMRTMNDWSNPRYDYTWWSLSRGLYRRVFANVGFDVEFVTSVARFVGTEPPPAPATREHARPTIIARRRAGAVLETFHLHNNAHAVLHEQTDATSPQQRRSGLRSLRREILGRLRALKRAISFRRSAIRAYDKVDATLRKHALSFTTPPGEGQYAISIYCHRMSAGAAVELDVQIDSGAVGIGFNEPTLSRSLSEEILIRAEDGRKKVRIVLAEAMPRAVLAVRNVSGNGKSQGTVLAINVIKQIAPV